MKSGNVVLDKSKAFGIRCVRLCRYLQQERHEHVISRQLLRSGTSIGANVKEGQFAQSKADFTSKLTIAKKEAGETEYWVEILQETGYLTAKESSSILTDCRELLKLLQSITKKLQGKPF